MTKKILEPQVTDTENSGYLWQYGYGMWFVSVEKTVIRMGLIGEDPGASARMFYYPEKNIEVVILANIGEIAGTLGLNIHHMIMDSEI